MMLKKSSELLDTMNGNNMKTKTYEQIIEISKKKALTVKQFDRYFKPLEQDSTYLIDSSNKAEQIAKEYINELNLDTEPYQHIWTVLEGESGNMCTINGYHICNRMGYMVCETPWGSGDIYEDKWLHIEAKY